MFPVDEFCSRCYRRVIHNLHVEPLGVAIQAVREILSHGETLTEAEGKTKGSLSDVVAKEKM